MLHEKYDGKMAKAGLMKKQVVSFSGGRTSAYLCTLMKQIHGDDVDFVFIDTGAEHPKTYEFVKKCNDAFNLNLTCIRAVFSKEVGTGPSYKVVDMSDCKHDMQPFSELMEVYGVPSIKAIICTERLKSTPFKKYCNDKYGKKQYMTWLGIRIDEPKRLKEMDMSIDMFAPKKEKKFSYLAEISQFTKDDVLGWWSNQPFDLEIPEHLGNCIFCVHKSPAKLALAARDEPEKANLFIDAVTSEKTRKRDDTYPIETMYRGKTSLRQIIASSSEHTRDELEVMLKYGKRYDSGSCTESCEAFSADLFD